MKTILTLCVQLAAAVMSAASVSFAAVPDTRPFGTHVTDAKAAVQRMLGNRMSPLGFASITQHPFAVCGSVYVRGTAGEDGQRPFVYALVDGRAYILDRPTYPREVPSALATIRHYCTPWTGDTAGAAR